MHQATRSERMVVSTHDRAEAPALLRRTFPGVALALPAADGPFVFRHSTVGDHRLRTSELMMSGPAIATGLLPEGVVAAGEVVAGHFTAEYARARVDTSGPFLRPGGPARMTFRDVHLRVVEFDGEAFRSAAERYEVDGARRRLSRTTPRSPSAAEAWAWTAAHIHTSVRDPRALDNPIVATELFDLGVRMLLACFAEPAGEDTASSVATAPRAVRRAVAYLEEHALDAVTVPDVAAAARISVRSLQSLFRQHLGVSPVEHLHAIRLESARRDLIAAKHDAEETVRTVAERWGFTNSGRFARLYAERFGERPSQTLRAER